MATTKKATTIHTLQLSENDIWTICHALNSEAAKYETMVKDTVRSADARRRPPGGYVTVWQTHAHELRELSTKVLRARIKKGR